MEVDACAIFALSERDGEPVRRNLAMVLVLCASCVHQTTVVTTYKLSPPPGPNELSAVEQATGWRLLFDGKTFAGWHGLGFRDVPAGQWRVDSGAIHRVPGATGPVQPDGRTLDEMDLASDSTWRDFELSWEWRIAPAGNSGLKYNVSDSLSATMSAPHSAKGWEYQLNDDERNEDNKLASHRSGALYDIVAPREPKPIHPAGQWNSSSILVHGTHGEHWLNGEQILSYELDTPAFDSAFAASKYAKYPGWFARPRAGSIVLQDHGDEVWFRSIKIRRSPLGRAEVPRVSAGNACGCRSPRSESPATRCPCAPA
jgi:hypothetical protein